MCPNLGFLVYSLYIHIFFDVQCHLVYLIDSLIHVYIYTFRVSFRGGRGGHWPPLATVSPPLENL